MVARCSTTAYVVVLLLLLCLTNERTRSSIKKKKKKKSGPFALSSFKETHTHTHRKREREREKRRKRERRSAERERERKALRERSRLLARYKKFICALLSLSFSKKKKRESRFLKKTLNYLKMREKARACENRNCARAHAKGHTDLAQKWNRRRRFSSSPRNRNTLWRTFSKTLC